MISVIGRQRSCCARGQNLNSLGSVVSKITHETDSGCTETAQWMGICCEWITWWSWGSCIVQTLALPHLQTTVWLLLRCMCVIYERCLLSSFWIRTDFLDCYFTYTPPRSAVGVSQSMSPVISSRKWQRGNGQRVMFCVMGWIEIASRCVELSLSQKQRLLVS